MLNNTLFPYSCIHFTCKRFTYAHFYVWEFYFDNIFGHIYCSFHFSTWEIFRQKP